jgi:hypothetical protein
LSGEARSKKFSIVVLKKNICSFLRPILKSLHGGLPFAIMKASMRGFCPRFSKT